MFIKRKGEMIETVDGIFPGIVVLAWFLVPVRLVIQNNPGLSETDFHTHSLAFQEYGFQFTLAAGAFSILYLSLPYLWAACLNVCRHIRARPWKKNDHGTGNVQIGQGNHNNEEL
jgi:hypothetical protein